MVVTALPAGISLTGTLHDRASFPSTCTEQAPQAAIPQPNLVPVSARSSRSTHSSGVSAYGLHAYLLAIDRKADCHCAKLPVDANGFVHSNPSARRHMGKTAQARGRYCPMAALLPHGAKGCGKTGCQRRRQRCALPSTVGVVGDLVGIGRDRIGRVKPVSWPCRCPDWRCAARW